MSEVDILWKSPLENFHIDLKLCPDFSIGILQIQYFLSPYFLKNQVWKIKLDELYFLSISNLIFTAWVVCKI